MFPLRCTFWLAVMYMFMFCGALRSPHSVGATATVKATGIAQAAVSRVVQWCAERPAECARDAARLNALAEMTAFDPPPRGAVAAGGSADNASPPLPAPDPRRQAVRSMLTDAR